MDDPTKDKCTICGKLLKKTSMKRHVETQHLNKKTDKEAKAKEAACQILTDPAYNQGTVFGASSPAARRHSIPPPDYRVPPNFSDEQAQAMIDGLEDWDFMDISSADDQSRQSVNQEAGAVKPKKRLQPEAAVQKKMEKKLGGGHVTCPAGIIDILTDTVLCEIKEWKSWKDALGQLFAYSFYYPGRMLHIHLFGELPSEEYRIMVITICTHYRVKVTHE